jgi:hypothetical protein
MGQAVYQRGFSGGELSPSLAARADLSKYSLGLRTCRNFIILRHGGVSNRPGLRFIGESKTSSTSTFLLRYVSELAGESVLIEAGPNYLRFYKNGALVTLAAVPPTAWSAVTQYQIGDLVREGGINYYAVAPSLNQVPPNATFWYAMPTTIFEVPTPFGNAGFNWVQSGTVITMTSLVVPPHELIYVGLTHWIIRPVSTAPAILPPTGLGTAGGAAGALTYSYLITSAAAETYEESIASLPINRAAVAAPTTAVPIVLTWGAVAGAVEYYVYLDPYGNGTYGYIGTATGLTSFNDIGFTPDFAVTPPLTRILFTTANNYPARAAYYQQRRFFAHTTLEPDAVWGSRVGFASNFNISSPLQDDDAITFRIAGNQHNPVRHLVGLKALIVLTDAGEWTIGQAKIPLTPNNLPADQELYIGVNDVVPVIVGNAILYVQARGEILRDVRFDQQVEGLAGRDLTLYAAHLFDGYTIDKLDFAITPHSIVWAIRSDGTLLGLTYIRDEDVWGWHRHTTGASGLFEDVCVVPEAGEDAVYVLVRRTIGGVFTRYIERLERREIQNFAADSFFVDSGLTYSGVPVTAIGGLTHLVGQVVAVVADGVVIFDGDPASANAVNYTVSATGTIPAVLTTAASVIHAGLAIRFAEIETLDLDVQGSSVRDAKKRVGSVGLLIDDSVRTFKVGPSSTRLTTHKLDPHEAGAEQIAFTGLEEINIESDWGKYGRVFIRHTDPLPLTILGILPNVELGS